MDIKHISAIYAIVIGLSMIGLWSMLFITDQIPQLSSGSIEIIYHLIAEVLTALLLMIAGISVIKGYDWSFHLFLISLGMLLYTAIVSAGYYADLGDMIIVGMFSIIQISTILIIIFGITNRKLFLVD